MKTYYRVSWTVSGAYYSRCFETEKERSEFIRLMIPNRKVSTWENEVEEGGQDED